MDEINFDYVSSIFNLYFDCDLFNILLFYLNFVDFNDCFFNFTELIVWFVTVLCRFTPILGILFIHLSKSKREIAFLGFDVSKIRFYRYKFFSLLTNSQI